jgi:membrane protein implicated in regulation of membrane protease activity
MGEIADYFRRERYITRRFSLLVLSGSTFLVPVTLATARGHLPPWLLIWAVITVAVLAAVFVVLILRSAEERFPISSGPDDLVMDKGTRRKLRRRILALQMFVVFYGMGLIAAIWHARQVPKVQLFAGIGVNLLMEYLLFKSIRRLKKKMDQAMNADFFDRVQSATRTQ